MTGKYTDAQKKATQKYLKESIDEFKIRVPKGQKEVIKAFAEKQGLSVNAWIVSLINEAIERDAE